MQKLFPNLPVRLFPNLPVWLFALLRWPSAETTEWFCLRAAAWWALMLLPGLHLFASNPGFAGLARVGAEGHWLAGLTAALAVQAAGVSLGNVWMRAGVLAAFGTFWASVAGLLWASSPHAGVVAKSTGAGVYAALALDCMAVAIHLVRLWYIDFLARQEVALLHPTSGTKSGITGSGIKAKKSRIKYARD